MTQKSQMYEEGEDLGEGERLVGGSLEHLADPGHQLAVRGPHQQPRPVRRVVHHQRLALRTRGHHLLPHKPG
jgi:hypothetical protein